MISSCFQNGQKVGIVRIVPQEKLEKVEIVPATRLQQGAQTKLKLVYAGLISNKLGGLYQTTYTENDGSKKWLLRVAAVTQMEPIDARSMVPCFDEPEFKATSFKIKPYKSSPYLVDLNFITHRPEDEWRGGSRCRYDQIGPRSPIPPLGQQTL
ncbi:unnamed protein product [Cylicostephanus goldi]|uniref:Aminopeptidase N-like N-terminal domain-containing protein n=1 Tax=Cylicostephanus goldi TaxID=71465 RepID=A0A3P6RU47_CYLGO|nr:unnamed protein product [Cylicostephanus goldi]